MPIFVYLYQTNNMPAGQRAFHAQQVLVSDRMLSTTFIYRQQVQELFCLVLKENPVYEAAPLIKNHLSIEASIFPGATSSLGGSGGSCSGLTRLGE